MSNEYIFFTDQTALTFRICLVFRALLCPSSGARDYMCVIAAYGVLCLVAGCRGSVQDSRLWVREEGCCTTRATSLFLDA